MSVGSVARKSIATILLSLSLLAGSGAAAWASTDTVFVCQCHAERPGFESSDGSRKFCDYSCSCQTFSASGISAPKTLQLTSLPTTAYSFEDWDRGSHICHGQYAWRPTLSSANWEIQTRFSSFKISNAGIVIFPDEGVETSSGVFEYLQRSGEAPEIRDAIRAKLDSK